MAFTSEEWERLVDVHRERLQEVHAALRLAAAELSAYRDAKEPAEDVYRYLLRDGRKILEKLK